MELTSLRDGAPRPWRRHDDICRVLTPLWGDDLRGPAPAGRDWPSPRWPTRRRARRPAPATRCGPPSGRLGADADRVLADARARRAAVRASRGGPGRRGCARSSCGWSGCSVASVDLGDLVRPLAACRRAVRRPRARLRGGPCPHPPRAGPAGCGRRSRRARWRRPRATGGRRPAPCHATARGARRLRLRTGSAEAGALTPREREILAAGRGRAQQRRDRQAAVHLGQDRERARLQRDGQAGRRQPHRGRGARPTCRPDRLSLRGGHRAVPGSVGPSSPDGIRGILTVCEPRP